MLHCITTMQLADTVRPHPSGNPTFTPTPVLLHDHRSAIDAWHCLLSGMPGCRHHPTEAFHVSDADDWVFVLTHWGTKLSSSGHPTDTYVIRVSDEHGHVVGYL